MTLSVVIPVFNEEDRIGEALRRIAAYLSLKDYGWEIIVSNDGSTDKTRMVADMFAMTHPQFTLNVLNFSPNHGKGYAARQGALTAKGYYVLVTDADLSAPIKEVDKLVAALDKGLDVAIGSRAVRAKGCDVRQSPRRWLAGRVFNVFTQLTVLPGIRDSQCGFKAFTRTAAHKLFSAQKLDGFSFDVEVLYLARRYGLRIAEVPVMWSEGSASKVRLLRDSTRMMKDLFRIKKLHRVLE